MMMIIITLDFLWASIFNRFSNLDEYAYGSDERRVHSHSVLSLEGAMSANRRHHSVSVFCLHKLFTFLSVYISIVEGERLGEGRAASFFDVTVTLVYFFQASLFSTVYHFTYRFHHHLPMRHLLFPPPPPTTPAVDQTLPWVRFPPWTFWITRSEISFVRC